MTDGKVDYSKFLSGRKSGIVAVTLVIVLAVSAGLNIHYHSSTQSLTNSVEGATVDVAREFSFSLSCARNILNSSVTPDNVNDRINTFRYHLQTAWGLLHALRIYLLSSYESQLLIIGDLIANMTSGSGGVGDTLYLLAYRANLTLLVQAFQELDATASRKISTISVELREAFEFQTRDHTVETFSIIPSRIENAVNAANDLKGILNEWVAKYSPP